MYRLALLVDISLWEDVNGNKKCWEIKIPHSDQQSELRIWDSRGAPRASFKGLRASQNDALALINFSARPIFSHTYGRAVAGRMA